MAKDKKKLAGTDTMLYKHPGIHEIHNDKFDYIIVDDSEIDDMIEAGWSLTTTEAKEKSEVETVADKGTGWK